MNALKQVLARLRAFFPSPLPIGEDQFEEFFSHLCHLYDVPVNGIFKSHVASVIMHLGTTVHAKPLRFFMKALKKAQANQVAYDVIQSEREKEKNKEVEDNQTLTLEGSSTHVQKPVQN